MMWPVHVHEIATKTANVSSTRVAVSSSPRCSPIFVTATAKTRSKKRSSEGTCNRPLATVARRANGLRVLMVASGRRDRVRPRGAEELEQLAVDLRRVRPDHGVRSALDHDEPAPLDRFAQRDRRRREREDP